MTLALVFLTEVLEAAQHPASVCWFKMTVIVSQQASVCELVSEGKLSELPSCVFDPASQVGSMPARTQTRLETDSSDFEFQ